MSGNRLIGVILTIVGLGLALIAGLWLASQVSTGALTAGGAALGAGLAFIPVAALTGFGLYLYVKSGAQAQADSQMQKQRRLLDIVKSRGQVSVNDVALEMATSVDDVRTIIHQLVGLQVFSGYINWKDGTVYSAEAASLRDLKQCRNCGGEIVLAGKGVVTCKYCSTEYFLS